MCPSLAILGFGLLLFVELLQTKAFILRMPFSLPSLCSAHQVQDLGLGPEEELELELTFPLDLPFARSCREGSLRVRSQWTRDIQQPLFHVDVCQTVLSGQIVDNVSTTF